MINICIDFLKDFFFKFIFFSDFGVDLLWTFALLFNFSFEPVKVWLDVPIVLLIV